MKDKHQILLFIIITSLTTLILTAIPNLLANSLAQATPAMTALFLILLSKNKKYEITNTGILRLGRIYYYFPAILLPFITISLAYLVANVFSLVHFSPWTPITDIQQSIIWFFSFFYKYCIYIFLWPLIWSIGEEIGWRGYLQPKLTYLFGFRRALFLTGIIWAFWHYIFIFFGGYYDSGNIIINTLLFTATVTCMAFTIGWIRQKSSSIWPCVVFHSASNAAWQMWSYQYKVVNPKYIYVAGEAGIVNIVFWSICLFMILHKQNKNDSLLEAYRSNHFA